MKSCTFGFVIGMLFLISGFDLSGQSQATDSIQIDSSKRNNEKTWAIVGLPFVFYSPETRWAIGLGGIVNFEILPNRQVNRPSFSQISVYVSQNKQAEAYIIGENWFGNNRYKVVYDLTYRIFPDFFWGVGNETPEGNREKFDQRSWLFKLEGLKQIGNNKKFYFGLRYEFRRFKMVEIKPEGILATDNIAGSDGGRVSGAGWILNFENRDNVFYTTKGSYYNLAMTLNHNIFGSQFNYINIESDFRQFFDLKKDKVIAFQAYSLITTNKPPFQMMGTIGSSNRLRGIYNGRYRDRNSVMMQVEYRMPLFWRFGMVAFTGIGRVSDDIGELLSIDQYKWTAGLGLRFMFNRKQKINIRFDAAYSELRETNFYFTIREAF
jgi:Omp85 superfamily domain